MASSLTSDTLNYEYDLVNIGNEKKCIVNDQILLARNDTSEKIMISYGLAQDIFLLKISNELNLFLTDFKYISNNLVREGYSKLTNKECYMIIGKIFSLMNKITFKKGFLDVPKYSFYKEYINTYNSVRQYHNISTRTDQIMNDSKLILDFYHVLLTEINEKRNIDRNFILLLLIVVYSVIRFAWYVVL